MNDRHFTRCKPLPGEDGYGCFWIGAAIGAGSSLLGGLFGNDAAEEAAEQQAEGIAQQIALQERMYDQQRADAAPWRETGGRALNRLEYLMGLSPGGPGGAAAPAAAAPSSDLANLQASRAGLQAQLSDLDNYGGMGPPPAAGEALDIWKESGGVEQMRRQEAERAALEGRIANYDQQIAAASAAPAPAAAPGDPNDPAYGSLMRDFTEDDFRADPGYQFRLSEGQKAIDRAAAARGMYSNPATVKELARYGQGVADQTYNDAFNRYQLEQGNRFNRLSALSGVGQTAVNQTQAAAQNYANQAGSAIAKQGAALAGGTLTGANALIGGLTGAGAGLVNQYAYNQGYGQQPMTFGTGATMPAPSYGGGMSRPVGGMGYRP